VRIPDNNRTWIAIGGQLKVGASSRWDFGYTHIFIEDASINRTQSQQAPGFTTPTPAPFTATTVSGNYKGSVDVLSVQYTYLF
jgi:long-chain fatty acid transport protein